jgi:hypothetical protein
LIPPGAPTINAAATSIVSGSSTSLTWSSLNATSCAASGSWTGTLAASGTQTVTPSTVGTATYSLTCANAAGTSTASSVSVAVTAAASGGGGGGSLTWPMLFALAGVALGRRLRTQNGMTPD